MKFNELLIQYRERSGMSKTKLANKIGVSPSYIMNVEAGRRHLSVKRVSQLIGILSLSDEEINIFFKSAFIESIAPEKREVFAKRFLQKSIEVTPPSRNIHIQHVPIISWVHANKFEDIHDSFPAGIAEDYVYTAMKGKNIFALKVSNDCMSPEFNEGDIIIVNPVVDIAHNDYVIIADRDNNTATFKQYKVYGNKRILHPINPKYQDIELDHKKRYTIVGKVVAKTKHY